MGVEDSYHRAHRECCLHEKKLPSALAPQELVTAWKRLRKGLRLLLSLDQFRKIVPHPLSFFAKGWERKCVHDERTTGRG